MQNDWIKWSERNQEFAPVVGLHQHHMFFPIAVENFLRSDCELMIFLTVDQEKGPVYGRVKDFPQGTLGEKLQWMLHPKMNKKYTYLDIHLNGVDMKKSAELQKDAQKQVYVRGFRNRQTGEAYITYWFFYLENFVPRSTNDAEILDTLKNRPDGWWTHEGDWEAVSVHFANYQESNPSEVIYSQHDTVKVIPWNEVEKEENRILAVPALGSHAMFNQPVRKKRLVFLAEVASPDVLLFPHAPGRDGHDTYMVEELDPEASHLWLHFKGRWGQSGGEFSKAPTGPLMKRKKHFRLLADINLN